MKTLKYIIAITLLTTFTSDLFGQGNNKTPIDQSKVNFVVDENISTSTPSIITINATPAPPPPPSIKKRLVFWVHGLGGDINAWSRAADASELGGYDKNGNLIFPPRAIDSRRLDYKTAQGSPMTSAGDVVRDEIRLHTNVWDQNSQLDPKYNFIVGHSQGGIVARTVQYLEHCGVNPSSGPKRFGGIVTFGTPNQGAAILNKLDAGYGTHLADYSCKALSAGPLQDQWLLRLMKKALKNKAGIDPCDLVTPVTSNLIQSFQPLLTKDYRVGAPFLTNQLSNCKPTNMSRMAFYGVEPRDKIFWRSGNWFIGDVIAEHTFDANDDLAFYNDVGKEILKKYTAEMIAAYSASMMYKGTLFGSWKFLPSKKYKEEAEAWKEGVDWVTNVNHEWAVITGSLEVKTKNELVCICYDRATRRSSVTPFNQASCINTGGMQGKSCFARNITKVAYIHHDSDGVVLAESAKDFPGATHVPEPMYGSSHMQMRNDDQLRIKLTKLYKGDYDKFFQTRKL